MQKRNNSPLSSSYKDPSGYVFKKGSEFYRFVSDYYKDNYDQLMGSGLYKDLVNKKMMISHTEEKDSQGAYKIIKPQQIKFMNYPYEWSFSQLKDAAILTLDICLLAIEHGMILKDASAYNVTFFDGKPIFIDTLSFEKYEEGKPWVAYGQFCRHFLAPLVVSAYKDLRFISLLRNYLDGFPLDFISKLLPKSSLLNMGLAMHLHAHARATVQLGGRKIGKAKELKVSKFQLIGLIRGLRGTIASIKLPHAKTQWGDYYNDHNYSDSGFNEKQNLIETIIKKHEPKTVLDLGANNGEFSRSAVFGGAKLVISTDVDPIAVEKNYQTVISNKEKNILPLYLDITNPSGNVGFALSERESFFKRGNFDMVMALALIHHLVITYNLPLSSVAHFLSSISPMLVIEFVPKEDSQVKRLLQNREDIFGGYTQEGFESAFTLYFSIVDKYKVKDSLRTIYVMKKKL